MKIIKSFNILNNEIKCIKNIAFVPTMGSLHKGHISLIKNAKKKSQNVLVSIFVNPTQFNKKKDYSMYPRDLKNDIFQLKRLKINYLFLPTTNEIYKKGIKRSLPLSKTDLILCAKYRKGHFEGVLGVVNRFLSSIKVKYLFLGEKDFQQIYLIKKYLSKKFNTKVIVCKTIRNKRKLPLSSRNVLLSNKYLSKSERISQIMYKFKRKLLTDYKNINLIEFYKTKIRNLCDNIEYFEVRHPENLSKTISKKKFKIFIAYHQNKIRLIDNV